MQIEKLRLESNKLSLKYRQGDRSINQLIEKIGEMGEQLDLPKRELQEKQQQEEARLSQIEGLRHDIDKLNEELDNLPLLEDIKPGLDRLLKEMSAIDTKIRDIQVSTPLVALSIV